MRAAFPADSRICSSTSVPLSTPAARSVPGVYGSLKVALNASERVVAFSPTN